MPSALLPHPPRRAARSPGTRSRAGCPELLASAGPLPNFPTHHILLGSETSLGLASLGQEGGMLTRAVGAAESGRGRDRLPGASGHPLLCPEARDDGWERPYLQPLLVVTERVLPQ